MARLIILIILVYILYRLIKGAFLKSMKNAPKGASETVSEMVQDPFCKTYIPRGEAYRKVIDGKDMFFCSRECADKFELEHRD